MKLRTFYHVAQFHQPSPAILARRAVIAAEMARVAKASESDLPADERRGVYLTEAEERAVNVKLAAMEGGRALRDMAVACAVAAPVVVFWIMNLAVPG